MSEPGALNNGNEISAQDIVFDCPACGKSLAIDRRGAGMAITCPDCEQDMIVPSPARAEVGAIEMTPEQRIDALSTALQESHADIRRLHADLSEVAKRRKYLERVRSENIKRMERIAQELTVLQSVIDRVGDILQDSSEDPSVPG